MKYFTSQNEDLITALITDVITEVRTVAQSDFSPQELEAIWYAYQDSGGADCPHCDGRLTVALNEHPLEGQGVAPSIVVACQECRHSSHDFPRNHAIWA